ncbi:MAG TPA: hypothetical protein VK742_17255 [Candidatus Sulfotelmatobacter sp.]|jgi:hypothetical protein|nr:hypothetical protein [Candidatus Sulfotelmatobacter sp.]
MQTSQLCSLDGILHMSNKYTLNNTIVLVGLLIAVPVVIWLPRYIHERKLQEREAAQAQACLDNLKRIDAAANQFATDQAEQMKQGSNAMVLTTNISQ